MIKFNWLDGLRKAFGSTRRRKVRSYSLDAVLEPRTLLSCIACPGVPEEQQVLVDDTGNVEGENWIDESVWTSDTGEVIELTEGGAFSPDDITVDEYVIDDTISADFDPTLLEPQIMWCFGGMGIPDDCEVTDDGTIAEPVDPSGEALPLDASVLKSDTAEGEPDSPETVGEVPYDVTMVTDVDPELWREVRFLGTALSGTESIDDQPNRRRQREQALGRQAIIRYQPLGELEVRHAHSLSCRGKGELSLHPKGPRAHLAAQRVHLLERGPRVHRADEPLWWSALQRRAFPHG